jgi:signal transduction histidine kinase
MTHLSAPTLFLIAGFAASLLCAGAGAFLCLRLSRRLRLAGAQYVAAREGEASATRTLQLLAQELQTIALSLRGHADHLQADRHPNAPRMAATAAQLGGLADELGHHLAPAAQPIALICEQCPLADLVADGVRATQIAISPGCRHFRLRQPIDDRLRIWADPRALRLVLARVLSEAVRTSSHDDWIDIGCSLEGDQLCLRIEDEGAGATAASNTGPVQDSRGIGLRLSLARSLLLAHGGSLEVEALARVGTRVTIRLPPERSHRSGPVTDGSIA